MQSGRHFTPEDFTEEHLAIARAAGEFWDGEVAPHLNEIQHGNGDLAISLARKAADLGLVAVTVPEEYGGMGMGLTSAMVLTEHSARDASYYCWHGVPTG